jgi:hypothetical protein
MPTVYYAHYALHKKTFIDVFYYQIRNGIHIADYVNRMCTGEWRALLSLYLEISVLR